MKKNTRMFAFIAFIMTLIIVALVFLNGQKNAPAAVSNANVDVTNPGICNNNSICETANGEDEDNCPNDCGYVGGGGGSTYYVTPQQPPVLVQTTSPSQESILKAISSVISQISQFLSSGGKINPPSQSGNPPVGNPPLPAQSVVTSPPPAPQENTSVFAVIQKLFSVIYNLLASFFK